MALDLLPFPSDEKTYNAERWSPRHRLIVAMHAGGMKNYEIAKRLDMHKGTVSQILNDPRAAYELAELAQRVSDVTVDASVRLKLLSNEALDEIVEEMRTARDPRIRQKAAFGILDRAGYTPVRAEERSDGVFLPEDVVERMESTTKELTGTEVKYTMVEPKASEPEKKVDPSDG